MRRFIVFTTLMLLALTGSAFSQETWVAKGANIPGGDAKAVVTDGEDYFIATRREVYRNDPAGGNNWDSVFALTSGDNAITSMAGTPRNIFVGTRNGLFRSMDFGATWQRVFKSILPGKSSVECVDIDKSSPARIAIGTRSGVFLSEDSGKQWREITGNLKNKIIYRLNLSGSRIYAATDSGLYRKDNDSSGWKRLIVKSVSEEKEEGLEVQPESNEDRIFWGDATNCVKVNGNRVYTGSGHSLWYSKDGGDSWSKMPVDNLYGRINDILPPPVDGRLYCATSKGVFEFSEDNALWRELYRGKADFAGASQIVPDGEGEKSILAVTGKGLYKLEEAPEDSQKVKDEEGDIKRIAIISKGEPAFQALQQAAIRYAEVSPEKIKNWRRNAQLRALFPKVSFGLDKGISNTSEIYTSATRDYVTIGPDDVSRGWDLSVSWELGDLIWSDDQTNIDVRSRLMVQLRNDILDELRRVYYERRRIQFELTVDPPKNLKARYEKEMRFQELTQAIDDLTGNYLSENTVNGEKLI